MNEDSIAPEIHKLIDERIANGALVHVPWVASAILAERSDISGGDVAFYRDCAFKEVVRLVKRAIGKYDEATDTTPEQMVFPGFKHLVKAYSIERDGERVLVPTQSCTAAELRSRAEEMLKQSHGLVEHARELNEFAKLLEARAVA
jgi:hypothetical protein